MDENKKKRIVIVVVILALLIAGVVLFFILRKRTEPAPPPLPPPKMEKPVEKVEKLPDFIEKTEYYDSKELKAKYYVYRVKPEVKHKEYKEYYKSGKIKIECTYKDGQIDGPYIYWHENGQKALEGNIVNGLKHGPFNEFYASGRKKISSNYTKGKLDGLYQEFYDLDNSPVAIEKNYKNGQLLSEIHKKQDSSVKFEKDYIAELEKIK